VVFTLLTLDCQYSKALGNVRPESVIRLETAIWKAVFNIACGSIDVYAAAQEIADVIPSILDSVEDNDKSWFHFGWPNIPFPSLFVTYSLQPRPITPNKYTSHRFVLFRRLFLNNGQCSLN